jgi:hypothetical protein
MEVLEGGRGEEDRGNKEECRSRNRRVDKLEVAGKGRW